MEKMTKGKTGGGKRKVKESRKIEPRFFKKAPMTCLSRYLLKHWLCPSPRLFSKSKRKRIDMVHKSNHPLKKERNFSGFRLLNNSTPLSIRPIHQNRILSLP